MKKINITALISLFSISYALAGDEPPTPASNKAAIDMVQTHTDYLWTLVAAALVFFMQAGFAMVEAGFTRARNAVNIMMKNLRISLQAPWLSGCSRWYSAPPPPPPFPVPWLKGPNSRAT